MWSLENFDRSRLPRTLLLPSRSPGIRDLEKRYHFVFLLFPCKDKFLIEILFPGLASVSQASVECNRAPFYLISRLKGARLIFPTALRFLEHVKQ